jgi:hypothetical protein
MGLLDKLFGSAGKEVIKQLKDTAQSVAKEATNAMNNVTSSANATSSSNASRPQTGSAATIRPTERPLSGDSWGPEMPAEENQFNSGKSYDQYFYDIFVENFPSYRVTTEKIRGDRATLITFWADAPEKKALVVELMSDTSSAESTRVQCRREGIPYLRFYYNHEGWWNTKSYVIRRTLEALNL